MPAVLAPITIAIDAEPTPSETTMRPAGPHVVKLTTALPELPLTVTTAYVGADDVPTTAITFTLGRRPAAQRTIRTLAHDEVPVTHALDRCVLDHLTQVRPALDALTERTATIEADDAVLDTARDGGAP
jgi:hypothetical protein